MLLELGQMEVVGGSGWIVFSGRSRLVLDDLINRELTDHDCLLYRHRFRSIRVLRLLLLLGLEPVRLSEVHSQVRRHKLGRLGLLLKSIRRRLFLGGLGGLNVADLLLDAEVDLGNAAQHLVGQHLLVLFGMRFSKMLWQRHQCLLFRSHVSILFVVVILSVTPPPLHLALDKLSHLLIFVSYSRF